MALIHWQPVRGIDFLNRDLNRLFDALPKRESTQFISLVEISEAEVQVNLSSNGDCLASKSEEPQPESDAANADTEKPNQPDGGYGNTTETKPWNEESSDSSESSSSTEEG